MKKPLESSSRATPLSKLLKYPFEEELRVDDDGESAYVLHPIPGWLPARVPSKLYLNSQLIPFVKEEVQKCRGDTNHSPSGFIPSLMQLVNVSCLPGIVGASIGLPDLHSGYGFAIGHVAAFDMDDPEAIVSPGGVGFDINCGVRLIRTNLLLEDIRPVQDRLAKVLFENLPAGVGEGSSIKLNIQAIDSILKTGSQWAVENGYAWPEDLETCEENGCISMADPKCVSQRAKGRGLVQLGSLGAGNHYAEIQAVSEIFDETAAKAMGITSLNQICIMVHCGSRGLGHEIASNYVEIMAESMKRDSISIPDPQLSCARISSSEGQEYLKAMAAAANYAYCNRSVLTSFIRKSFETIFEKGARDMDMHLVYDVSHNMAKIEDHILDGVHKRLLVHRKGATRAFPPEHPSIPAAYSHIGQPVLVGGTMGTFSYVLTGTHQAMEKTFGSTCHGAGRAKSRVQSKKAQTSASVLKELEAQGISICVANPESIAEEAPNAYKDIQQVVDSCERAGLSRKVLQLRPIAVIKG